MLDYLWHERSLYYLKGAWAGPHAGAWPHDVPQDGNVLFDYVQFGDFPLPVDMPRTEFAGFLFYEAPEDVRRNALDRSMPTEVRKISRTDGQEGKPAVIHRYCYITEDYATGGVWERVLEQDNEQHRWDVTLPLTGSPSINQAFFFHPGGIHAEGDPRHESDIAQVMFHQNVVLALYPIPEGEEVAVRGVLPKGEWLHEPNALFGRVEQAYIAVHLQQPCELEERSDRWKAIAPAGPFGVAVEAIGTADAERLCIGSLAEFAAVMREHAPTFAPDASSVAYRSLAANADLELELSAGPAGDGRALVGGEPVSLDKYEA
jgi:hypothetical protein